MIKVLGKKNEYKYLQSLGIEYKMESKKNYTKNKYALKRLVSRTEILGRYGEQQKESKEKKKQQALQENGIYECKNNSELRYVSNSSLKEAKTYKYYQNKLLTCKKKNIRSKNLSILSGTNANFINCNRKKFSVTTYNKTQTIHNFSHNTDFQQFYHQKSKLSSYQLKAIKILTSPNNGIIFRKNEKDQRNIQNFQSQSQNGFQRQSAHFKTIEYSIGRRNKTMGSENASSKRYKGKKESREKNVTFLYPSPSQLEYQLTRKRKERLKKSPSIRKFTHISYQATQQNSQILNPYVTSTIKSK